MNIIVFIVFSYPLAAYARGTGNTSAIDGLLMLIIFGFFAYSIVKDSFRKKIITISILLPTFLLLYFQVMPAILGSVLIIAAPLIGFALEPSKKSSSKENSSSSTLIEPTHFFSEPIKSADESLNSANSDVQKDNVNLVQDKPKLEFTTYLVNGIPHTYVDGKLKKFDK